MTTINKDAINATIEVMRNTQDFQFDMGSWVGKTYDETGNECGTSCCLAGFAYIAKTGQKITVEDSYVKPFYEEAKEYFNIDDRTASNLFTPSNDGIDQNSIETGIRALEYLRDTGEVLWDNGEFGEESYYDDEEDEYDY